MADRLRGSDLDLLGRIFESDAPELEPNLVLVVPDRDDLPKPVKKFDVTPPGGKAANPDTRRPYVRCAICKRHSHWKGLVYRYPDGTQFIAGRECAKTLFGDDYERFFADLDAEERRSRALRRRARALEFLGHLSSEIRGIARHPAIESFERLRLEFWNEDSIVKALGPAIEVNAGELWISEKIRDLRAEERRAEKEEAAIRDFEKQTVSARRNMRRDGVQPKLSKTPIYREERKRLGSIIGQKVVRKEWEPRSILGRCAIEADKLASQLSDPDTEALTTKQMEELLARLDTLLRDVLAVGSLSAEVRSFFSPRNLELIAQYLNWKKLGRDYRAADRNLFVFVDDQLRYQLRPPAAVAEIDVSRISRFLEILS